MNSSDRHPSLSPRERCSTCGDLVESDADPTLQRILRARHVLACRKATQEDRAAAAEVPEALPSSQAPARRGGRRGRISSDDVLASLARLGSATGGELAIAMETPVYLVRAHLDRLFAQGRIARRRGKSKMGNRPYLYTLAETED